MSEKRSRNESSYPIVTRSRTKKAKTGPSMSNGTTSSSLQVATTNLLSNSISIDSSIQTTTMDSSSPDQMLGKQLLCLPPELFLLIFSYYILPCGRDTLNALRVNRAWRALTLEILNKECSYSPLWNKILAAAHFCTLIQEGTISSFFFPFYAPSPNIGPLSMGHTDNWLPDSVIRFARHGRGFTLTCNAWSELDQPIASTITNRMETMPKENNFVEFCRLFFGRFEFKNKSLPWRVCTVSESFFGCDSSQEDDAKNDKDSLCDCGFKIINHESKFYNDIGLFVEIADEPEEVLRSTTDQLLGLADPCILQMETIPDLRAACIPYDVLHKTFESPDFQSIKFYDRILPWLIRGTVGTVINFSS